MGRKRRRAIESNKIAAEGFLAIVLVLGLPCPNSAIAAQLTIAAATDSKESLAQTNQQFERRSYNAVDIERAAAAYKRGQAYFSAGQFHKAVDDYSTAIEILERYKGLDDYKGEFYFNRGLAYDRLGQLQKAVNDYTLCLARSPGYIRAYNNRAVANYKLRRYSDAIADANSYLKDDQQHPEMYAIRGLAQIDMGNRQGIVDLKIAAGMGHKLAQDALRQAGIQW